MGVNQLYLNLCRYAKELDPLLRKHYRIMYYECTYSGSGQQKSCSVHSNVVCLSLQKKKTALHIAFGDMKGSLHAVFVLPATGR